MKTKQYNTGQASTETFTSASLHGNIVIHCSYKACSDMDTMEMDDTCTYSMQGGEGCTARGAMRRSLPRPRRDARSPRFSAASRLLPSTQALLPESRCLLDLDARPRAFRRFEGARGQGGAASAPHDMNDP